MYKKLCVFICAILMFSESIYAQEMIEFKENPNFEAEDVLNGNFVPVMDTLVYPKMSMFSTPVVTDKAYTQLSDVEKNIYDGFAANINLSKDGTSVLSCQATIKVTPGYDVNTQEGYDKWFADIQAYIGSDLGYNLSRALYAYYSYDHPECFWINVSKFSVGVSASRSNYNKNTGQTVITFNLKPTSGNYYNNCYTSASQINTDIILCNAAINNIIKSFPENATDYNKMLIINEWLLANNSYNHSSDMSDYAYIAPSALIYGNKSDTTKYPVCEGYAEAFKMICDKAGINCVCGEAFYQNAGHKWNLVQLDGKWYYYDATWNDSGNLTDVFRKNLYAGIGINTMNKYDTTFYHDLDKAQLGFSILTPQDTDYLEDKGVNGVRVLDINKDNYINKVDCASALKLLRDNGLSSDINKDNVYNMMDVTDYLRLLFK